MNLAEIKTFQRSFHLKGGKQMTAKAVQVNTTQIKLDFSIQRSNVWSIFFCSQILHFQFHLRPCGMFYRVNAFIEFECTTEHGNINLFLCDGSSFILSCVVLLYFSRYIFHQQKYPEPVLFREKYSQITEHVR